MEVLKRFQGSTFDTIARRRLVEDRDTKIELTARIQELQNEVNCTKIREISKMLNQYAVDNPTLPVNQCLSQLVRDPGGMPSRSLGMTWYIGKLFCSSNGVFFSTLSAGVESMEFLYIRTNSPFSAETVCQDFWDLLAILP